MDADISKWPLLVLMQRIDAWIASAKSEAFWRNLADSALEAEAIRENIKSVIVWLEMTGQEEAASRLDERAGAFREALWGFHRACEGTYPPEDFQCREHREKLIDTAELVAGVCEDLDGEVPLEFWEGFPGE